jgi:hypothetical protein
VLIRIDEYRNGRIAGLLYNPYLETGTRFVDVLDFTNQLDAMFDFISFPQATVQYRSFGRAAAQKSPQGRGGDAIKLTDERPSGQEADSFIVHVQFRQNATWQGTIRWAGQNREMRFRSTLELLKIMDSALAESHPGSTQASE